MVKIMKETVNAFLQHLVVERGFSQNTLDAYSNDLNQFREFVAGYLKASDDDAEAWRSVDLDLLNAYISELRDKKKYRDSTTARKVAAVRSFFGYLSANELISEDPTENLGSPRVGRSVPKFISEDDVKLLLSHRRRHWYPGRSARRQHPGAALRHRRAGQRVGRLERAGHRL